MSQLIHAFVATIETQGHRSNDFCFVPEGEIVTFPVMTCTNEKPDGRCGCCRSMAGTKTHKATTTMKVVEVDRVDIEQSVLTELREGGWSKYLSPEEEYEEVKETVLRIADEASQFPLGTVVELRGNEFQAR